MTLDELERRVAALRKADSGAALVLLNEDGTWTAVWGVPQKHRCFPSQEDAKRYIQKVVSDNAPIIIIDL